MNCFGLGKSLLHHIQLCYNAAAAVKRAEATPKSDGIGDDDDDGVILVLCVEEYSYFVFQLRASFKMNNSSDNLCTVDFMHEDSRSRQDRPSEEGWRPVMSQFTELPKTSCWTWPTAHKILRVYYACIHLHIKKR